VNKKGANKGLGLLHLGEILGIKREEIMACGDSFNDLEMLVEAGIGVAMGNAEEDLKTVADYITDTNDNDGVAKAIEKFVLNR
jgi:hydroxymethylpyrimidine pyrophosphatase-like HAD family hydrolase